VFEKVRRADARWRREENELFEILIIRCLRPVAEASKSTICRQGTTPEVDAAFLHRGIRIPFGLPAVTEIPDKPDSFLARSEATQNRVTH